MTWLAWRQQRAETLIAAVVFLLVAALLVPTGIHIASVYSHDGIGSCLAHSSGDCEERVSSFGGRWDSLVNLMGWFNLLPGLVGALLAAPLVIELERGTFRLAWTQSVTRRRWLTTRLALLVTGAIAFSLLFTVLMTWWRAPLDHVNGRFQDGFDFEGFVPTTYTLFAAAIVLAVGVAWRRTAAAIGIGFIAFFVARIGIEGWVRRHYRGPIHVSSHGALPDLPRSAWILSEQGGFRGTHGSLPSPAVVQACANGTTKRSLDSACLARHHIVEYASAVYQPASRFWLFQGIEAGIFGVLALALFLFSIWWIRRRVS